MYFLKIIPVFPCVLRVSMVFLLPSSCFLSYFASLASFASSSVLTVYRFPFTFYLLYKIGS